MIRKTIFTMMAVALTAVTATAQDKRVELGATFGYTFSDGVTGNAVRIGTLGTFDSIDPLNAMSWGGRIGFLLSDNNEVGFLFNQQSTELDLDTVLRREVPLTPAHFASLNLIWEKEGTGGVGLEAY